MRLLLVASQYPPIVGGAELQAQRLVREFIAMGLEVIVLTQPCRGEAAEDRDAGARIVRGLAAVRLGPLWGLTYMASVARWMRRLERTWDVVHNQQVGLHSVPSVQVATELSRPCL